MLIGVPAENTVGENRAVDTPETAPPSLIESPKTGQRIGVPREIFPGEKRVATVPEVVGKLIKLGFSVSVESGAGNGANVSDDAYRAAGVFTLTSYLFIFIVEIAPVSDLSYKASESFSFSCI